MTEQMRRAGWRARLDLRFAHLAGRTCLTRRRHGGPLVVQRAFYPEWSQNGASIHVGDPARAAASEPCHVYLVHPPGGMVSGDELQIDLCIEAGAHAVLTTPAAGKFYRRIGQRVARLGQDLRVDDGTLEWLPQENIYYPDTAAELRTIVRLRNTARFIGWEIACFGLPAARASLGEGTVRQSFELWHDEQPVLLERTNLDRASLQARWGLAGHAALGTWIAFPATSKHLEMARSAALAADCANTSLACTMVDDALTCRAYGERADYLKSRFIELWHLLRPGLLGRRAVSPRIWAT